MFLNFIGTFDIRNNMNIYLQKCLLNVSRNELIDQYNVKKLI